MPDLTYEAITEHVGTIIGPKPIIKKSVFAILGSCSTVYMTKPNLFFQHKTNFFKL